MNKEEADNRKAEMREEIALLEARIIDLKEGSGPVSPDQSLGRLTRLDQMQAQAITGSGLREAQKRLGDLKYKLATIGTPLYRP